MTNILKKIINSLKPDELKDIKKTTNEIMSLEDDFAKLTDSELQSKTNEFKNRLKNGEKIDDMLVEAFATVREASWRVLGMKPFEVQVIGGIILHQGKIAEMKTGEGKTLVATLPAYLNALNGNGVHIITVNDYLAKRDMTMMGKLYNFLGLSVGCIVSGMPTNARREAYAADITYGTNNEFGFDYLRDNMVIYKEELVQRDKSYAIVDEVDSILIDEARTPLIISGEGDKSTKLYKVANSFVKTLTGREVDPNEEKPDIFNREIKKETVDYLIDKKASSCNLTEQGTLSAEKYFNIDNLADMENMEIAHHINQALRANYLLKKDIDYVVQNNEVLIVDEFTGRIMEGRRYSEGLHQAIEAKENIEVKSESKTLATITFQNYFRMYDKLSGMTGTAKTEESEFKEIYGMQVLEVPTNKPVIRDDKPDTVYLTKQAKYNAIVEEVKKHHKKGQPILVGTISIEDSELLSRYLKKAKIKHEVLNAKHHMKEAAIVSQAGRYKAVTIATNMAGRGTDIVLGGNPSFIAKQKLSKKYSNDIINSIDSLQETDDKELLKAKEEYNKLLKKLEQTSKDEAKKVKEAGGLYIIGTERHESRRIDNQLRGRSGRQGDPGASKFFLSLEDDFIMLFGGDKVKRIIDTFDVDESAPLEHRILTNTIESAQKKIENNNFAIRKHVLQYDDVMNKQREVIYTERLNVLNGKNLKTNIQAMIRSIIDNAINSYLGEEHYSENWGLESLSNYLENLALIDESIKKEDVLKVSRTELKEDLIKQALTKYEEKEKEIGEEGLREVERVVLLQVVDSKWMDHIDAMDQLRQGIGLRAAGQMDPIMAYQNEGFQMFEEMNNSIKEDTIKYVMTVEKTENIERKRVAKETGTSGGAEDEVKREPIVKAKKIGRNEPCPCGSGKKYKKCCGANN